MRVRRKHWILMLLCGVGNLLAGAGTVQARTRLENICTVAGQNEHRLIGLGLVIGLKGTGDSKNLPTIRAMAAALRLMFNPVENATELKDLNNVALVMIEATIPAQGTRKGQKLDCHVSAIGGAKSLRGGRLMNSPLSSQLIDDERVMGLASGALAIEDATTPTSAKITGGGSGGTVAVLGKRGALPAVERVTARYAAETGHTPIVLSGTSKGAADFGSLTLLYA